MIHLETIDDLAVLRLAHGKVNAVDLELFEALSARLGELAVDPPAALVITGEGAAFSAGVDLFRVLEQGEAYLRSFLPAIGATLRQLFGFERPVVAAVGGHAIAGGCVLAAACDRRVMVESGAKIGVTELRVGVPFPVVAIEVLRALLPAHRVQDLVYTGRLLDPQEALAVGLVDELAAPERVLGRACELARELGALPRASFAVTKRQLRTEALERMAQRETELEAEVRRIWETPEVLAAMRAFVEKNVGKKR